MGVQKGFNRADVIAAAGELADAHGLHEVTLAMLASKLGVRSQSLYAHIDGIDGLRRDLALLGQHELSEALRDAVMAQSGVAALKALCRAYAGYALAHPGLYEATLRRPETDEVVRAANERVAAPFFAVLASLGIDGDDAVHRYRLIWTSLYGFATARTAGLMSWPVDPDDSLERLIALLAADGTTPPDP